MAIFFFFFYFVFISIQSLNYRRKLLVLSYSKEMNTETSLGTGMLNILFMKKGRTGSKVKQNAHRFLLENAN